MHFGRRTANSANHRSLPHVRATRASPAEATTAHRYARPFNLPARTDRQSGQSISRFSGRANDSTELMASAIPRFDEYGHLPVGGYRCSLGEMYERFRTNDHRKSLCDKFEKILAQARNCGFIGVIVGGSFPTAKDNPRDMDLTWITEPDVTIETVRPECRNLMDAMAAEDEYGWSMLYLAIDRDAERIQYWTKELGWCVHTQKDRGTLILDL